MIRKFGPLAFLFLAACSGSPSGGTKTDETGGGGGDESTGGKTGGSAGKGGSTGSAGKGGGGSGGSVGTGGSSGGAGGSVGTGGRGEGGGAGGASGGAGGGGNTATGYKFGAHPQMYPAGSIKPAGTQAELDAAVTAAYDKWKMAYVMMLPACGGHVVKTATNTTSSAALGHGMIISAMMAGHDPQAQTVFDGMFAVGRKFASILSIRVPEKHGIKPREGNQYLLANAIGNNCTRLNEDDSAPDGDLAFGFALLLADKQWGSTGKVNYLDEAKKTANAIKLYDMNPSKLPGLGDWASLPGEGSWTTVATPPNYTLGHFRAFAKASGEMYWMQALDAAQTSIGNIQGMFSAMTGLYPQVLVGSRSLSGGTFLSENNANAHFGDAALAPLWLAGDYIATGDAKSKAALTKITDWLKTKTGGDPSKIVDGYRLNGDNIGSKGTMAYVAPFASIAAFDAANQAWLDATWKLMAAAPTTNQFADTANLLGMLMVTGNWWQP